MKLTIISGRSGSGKSVALNTLSDFGYYCIDNLPLGLLSQLQAQIENNTQKVAVSIDARNLKTDNISLKQSFATLNQKGITTEIIYLDATDEVLLKRFSETRRKHPLTNTQSTLQEAIDKERDLLEPIASLADLQIDTSHLSIHQLYQLISERLIGKTESKMAILFQSFGYKYGLPADCDYVFDVRCLPNPYWLSELRAYTGKDEPVVNFLSEKPLVKKMLHSIQSVLTTWAPQFSENNRSYLTVAIGCTGGKHRSVFLAEQLFSLWQNTPYTVHLRHRELS